MYLVRLKALFVDALVNTFGINYPEADFRNLRVSIEYPVTQQHYPGIWVDYDDTSPLMRAGVAHTEEALIPLSSSQMAQFTRWRFQGQVTLTCVALSSLERDRLFDTLVGMFAFEGEDPNLHAFRAEVETNDFIAANVNFDTLNVRGNASAPGTPWGTDDIIYERSLAVDVIGEFVLDRYTNDMVALRAITVQAVDTTDQVVSNTGTTGAPAGDGWI